MNKNWKELFRDFYDDNESGGSSRWLVAPNTVQNFIEGLMEDNKRLTIYPPFQVNPCNLWNQSDKVCFYGENHNCGKEGLCKMQ